MFDDVTGALEQVNEILSGIFTGIIIVGAACLLVYAVYIAFKLAKAEDDGKRKEAKNHLMWAIIGLVAAITLVGLINTVLTGTVIPTDDSGQKEVDAVLAIVKEIIEAVFNLSGLAAAVFAGFIAYKLITANDDGKRKQAKLQLVWTLVAIIGIYALQGLISYVLTELLVYTKP